MNLAVHQSIATRLLIAVPGPEFMHVEPHNQSEDISREGADETDVARWPAPTQAWGSVSLLMVAYFVSCIDRSILSLLVEPIKQSLSLSDTQIGLLQGPAFGIFFMLAAFPAGWVADKRNRMSLIGWGIACWSIMTALCGMCTTFVQLFLARMGVAIGEATLQPTAPSVISDNFPAERGTLPMSLYALSASMGAGASLIAGGTVGRLLSGHETVTILELGTYEPWQVTFFIVGLPGLVISLMFFMGCEPSRRNRTKVEGTFGELFQVMRDQRSILVPHFAGVCLTQIYGHAYLAWMPSFFMRIHGWSMMDVGLQFGAVYIVFGSTGAWVGGLVARQYWRRGRPDANFLTGGLFFGVMTIPAILGTIVADSASAVALLSLTIGCLMAPAGANVAAFQEITPNRLRGRITAIYYAIIALGGMTIGPLMIGVMNDYMFTDAMSLGRSISLMAFLTLPTGVALILLAGRRYRRIAK